MIPRVLRNFGTFVDGTGYAGRCQEAELPEISVKTEEVRGSGWDGTAEVDMGLEAMTAKLTFNEYIEEIAKKVGSMNGLETRVHLRGAMQRDGEKAISIVAELGGSFKKGTMGTWKPGDLATHEIEMSVRYYKLTMGGKRIYEIDVENMIRFRGDFDEYASIREAMGY